MVREVAPKPANKIDNSKHEDGDGETLELSQSEANGVTTYRASGKDLIADGVARPIPDWEELREVTMTGTCGFGATEGLIVNIKGKVFDGGQYSGDLDVVINHK